MKCVSVSLPLSLSLVSVSLSLSLSLSLTLSLSPSHSRSIHLSIYLDLVLLDQRRHNFQYQFLEVSQHARAVVSHHQHYYVIAVTLKHHIKYNIIMQTIISG